MIVGQSPAMQQLMKMVIKVARTDANILITGENGTGKEMLAREIHHLSPRRKQEMVTVNMGAISESLFESELSGTNEGLLPMLTKAAPENSKQLREVPSLWTKSVTCLWECKQNC